MQTLLIRFSVIVAALVLSTGCGRTAGNPSTQSGADQVGQSIHTSMTLPPHDFAAVVKVLSPSGTSYCSGTFVTGHTVLTAAHCTLENGTYTVVAAFGTFTTAKKNALGNGTVYDASDIALLTFDEDVAAPDQVIAVGNEVHQNEELYLVGFGCDNFYDHTGGETKREGRNRVSQITSFLEFITPTPLAAHSIISQDGQSATCFGDSGGAGIKRNTDGTYALVGVIHSGGVRTDGLSSQLVDLTRQENQAFIHQNAI